MKPWWRRESQAGFGFTAFFLVAWAVFSLAAGEPGAAILSCLTGLFILALGHLSEGDDGT